MTSFLALGDSYTIGEGVTTADRWPNQLATRLRGAGVAALDVRIIAKTGWTTEELLSAIAAERVTGKFDLVSLLAGVNDQYRGYGTVRFRTGFQPLLASALSFAKLPGRLIVLSIPDWGITPFAQGRDATAIGREIDAFNAVIREMATGAGARFVDITPGSRKAATDTSLLASDGLHPSGKMYAQWVEQVVPIAHDALASSK